MKKMVLVPLLGWASLPWASLPNSLLLQTFHSAPSEHRRSSWNSASLPVSGLMAPQKCLGMVVVGGLRMDWSLCTRMPFKAMAAAMCRRCLRGLSWRWVLLVWDLRVLLVGCCFRRALRVAADVALASCCLWSCTLLWWFCWASVGWTVGLLVLGTL